MARPPKDGTISRRIRLTLRGWRDGAFDVRPGVANLTTLRDWKKLVREAYQRSHYEILDALADGVMAFPEAVRTKKEKGFEGLVVAAREKIAAARVTGGFEALIEEFLETEPRKASRKQHEDIAADCRRFLRWLAENRDLEKPEEVTRKHWTQDNLRAYVADYIESNHKRWQERNREELAELAESEREEKLRRDRGAKQNSANRHVNSIGAFSQWLLQKDLIDADPAIGVRITATQEQLNREGDVRGLEPEIAVGFIEWARVYDKENPCAPRERPDALFWQWLLMSGATTYTEGVRVRPADCKTHEAESGTIPVHLVGSKGSARPRDVDIPEEVVHNMLRYAKKARIGPKRQIFPFTEQDGRKAWKHLLDFIAKRDPDLHVHLADATPYALRHTYARTLLRGGIDIYELMRLLGHSSIETTAIYLSRSAPDRRKLRAALHRFIA